MHQEELAIGVVCGQCDTWAAIGSAFCPTCANELALFAPRRSSIPPPMKPAEKALIEVERVPSPGGLLAGAAPIPRPSLGARQERKPAAPAEPKPQTSSGIGASKRAATDTSSGTLDFTARRATAKAPTGASGAYAFPPKSEFASLTQEELMEQARNYVCRSCSSGVPSGHKFCGRCGAAVPIEILNAQTLFFGDMQNPAKAKLILIRGEGMDGLSFHLKAEQHIVGRNGQLVFPDDPFVSPKHANFFYRDGRLVVRDEGSLNGVYFRVRGTVEVSAADTFLAGEQLFRLDPTPRASDGQDPDGTYFYSSPKHPSPFRLTQILQGGAVGMTVCARGESLQIGREGSDLNFPGDLYMSAAHCRIDEHGGKFSLTDLSSRNGTYVRIKSERDLSHGDYIFIGRKLLRVELNTN